MDIVGDALKRLDRAGLLRKGQAYWWFQFINITGPFPEIYVTSDGFARGAVDWARNGAHRDSIRRPGGVLVEGLIVNRECAN